MKAIFFKFQIFSGGFECVLAQMLLIQTLFSGLICIRRKVILSSIRRYDYFVCRVSRFRAMVDFSLTHPFNIVQHTLSHIVEHRKLDSLATLDNTV